MNSLTKPGRRLSCWMACLTQPGWTHSATCQAEETRSSCLWLVHEYTQVYSLLWSGNHHLREATALDQYCPTEPSVLVKMCVWALSRSIVSQVPWWTLLIPALGRQRLVDICELEVSLVYIVTSHPARATSWDLVWRLRAKWNLIKTETGRNYPLKFYFKGW